MLARTVASGAGLECSKTLRLQSSRYSRRGSSRAAAARLEPESNDGGALFFNRLHAKLLQALEVVVHFLQSFG
jgi:hypothetical protein